MRKLFALFIVVFASASLACSQDFEKIIQDFEKMTNDPKVLYGRNKAAGKYYDIRGFKMYAEVYGQGQPLLMIHGNSGSIIHFFNQIPYFSKKYKVIVADSRAQGKSTDNGDSLSYEMVADDYAALLDAMKIDSAFVLGWSDGGINGLLMAMRHPKKVKKLASSGANLWADSTAVPQEIWDMVSPTYQMLLTKPDKNDTEKNALKLYRMLMTQPNISASELHTIKCPVLIMGGDHDVIKPSHTMFIADNLPQSYLWIAPNSGHSIPVIYKDEFNKTVDQFFSKPYRVIKAEGRFY
jgi:pimeloyl-ACP methyl ester carboxylesterase